MGSSCRGRESDGPRCVDIGCRRWKRILRDDGCICGVIQCKDQRIGGQRREWMAVSNGVALAHDEEYVIPIKECCRRCRWAGGRGCSWRGCGGGRRANGSRCGDGGWRSRWRRRQRQVQRRICLEIKCADLDGRQRPVEYHHIVVLSVKVLLDTGLPISQYAESRGVPSPRGRNGRNGSFCSRRSIEPQTVGVKVCCVTPGRVCDSSSHERPRGIWDEVCHIRGMVVDIRCCDQQRRTLVECVEDEATCIWCSGKTRKHNVRSTVSERDPESNSEFYGVARILEVRRGCCRWMLIHNTPTRRVAHKTRRNVRAAGTCVQRIPTGVVVTRVEREPLPPPRNGANGECGRLQTRRCNPRRVHGTHGALGGRVKQEPRHARHVVVGNACGVMR